MSDGIRLGASPKALNLDVIENGVLVECKAWTPGVFYRILPWGTHNPRFRAAIETYTRRRTEAGNVEGLDDVRSYNRELQEDPEFIADAVLVDIDGMLNAGGNPIQYTRERGVQILADPEWRHLRDWIVGQSWRASNAYKEEVADAGNGLRPASRGKRAGAARSTKIRS